MTYCHFGPRVLLMPKAPGIKRDRTRSTLLVAVQEILLESSPASLSVPRVTALAGTSHGTFYNYFDSLDAAVDHVGGMLLAEHARLMDQVLTGVDDPAVIFAHSTRLTLRLAASAAGYGRLLFDSGLPVDRFLWGLRSRMSADVEAGSRTGRFHVDNLEVMASMASGSILGVALDLHRGQLPLTAIEHVTERLLRDLGVSAAEAARVARLPLAVPSPRSLPLTGMSSQPERAEAV